MSKATSSTSTVAVALVLCIGVVLQHPDLAHPLIQLRLARESPAPGFVFMQSVPSGAGGYVEERALVSDEDIQVASTIRKAHGLAIDIRITQEAALRLRKATKEHVGWRVGVLLAGQLLPAPSLIVGPPPGEDSTARTLKPPEDKLRIFVDDLPAGDADRIAAAVAARWQQR
jgi:hypothetical protein